MRAWLAAFLMTPILTAAAAAETVHFRSTTWPPTPLQLRLAKASGDTIAEQASVVLTGELYRPAGKGPFPAIVLLHPCSGRLPLGVEQGDAARGISDGCAGGGASVDVVMDAYGALLHLATLPYVDPDRVALVGYSYGAGV